ncbi:hypothetical protein BO82DRAFT_64509 [Aspergillus uvarum CBS 121591]|uniref:Uncharacterized protein n=1 Tax=Aspergillus uvarum CBS 121591 TaxID=1448315 RepID=A0A319CD64_9EURO|nr:hypothetical protein BO82DRAFT_64509 [Aspergillus uvarum CBS 121591]PYH82239.1 hypothetical protein BO82DRAFT_64509 [Aspergillus uvarum CBS 121591]
MAWHGAVNHPSDKKTMSYVVMTASLLAVSVPCLRLRSMLIIFFFFLFFLWHVHYTTLHFTTLHTYIIRETTRTNP